MLAPTRPYSVHEPGFYDGHLNAGLRVYTPMPDTRPNPLDRKNATPRRVPKLTVRSRSPDGRAADENWNDGEDDNGETQAARSRTDQLRSESAMGKVSSDMARQSVLRHQREDSKDSSARDRNPPGRQSGRKKGSGVFSFLALKEPSVSALEEFAEHEKRKAAQKSARSTPVVMHGVSSQKLPDHVPKVNSKWDGLPEPSRMSQRSSYFREKYKENDGTQRNSLVSLASSSQSETTRRILGSVSSKPSFRQSQDKRRSAVQAAELESDCSRPTSLREYHTHQQAQLRQFRGDEPLTTFLLPPSPPSGLQDALYSSSPPELVHSELHLQPDYGYRSSCTVTSSEGSPKTPTVDLAVSNFEGRLSSSASLDQIEQHLSTDGARTFYFSDTDEVDADLAGHDLPRKSLTTLRRASDKSTSSRSAVLSSTISEEDEMTELDRSKFIVAASTVLPNGGSGPNLVRNFSHVSKYYPRTTTTSSMGGVSAQAKPSSRERPRPKNNDVLPWEAIGLPEQTISTSPIANAESKKMKRLSYKLGRK